MWCLPGAPSAEFVWAMEDVLDIYTRPYDPTRPTVCLDETSKQLVGEVRAPLPAIPGHAARYDHHYVRNGVATVFMMLEPLTGRCRVQVTQRRTKKDWAQVMKRSGRSLLPGSRCPDLGHGQSELAPEGGFVRRLCARRSQTHRR